MKIKNKFIVTTVNPVEITKDKAGKEMKVQSIFAMIPGYTNEFQEKVGHDAFYEWKVFNEGLELLKDIKAGDKVEIEGYLNSREFNTDKGVRGYNLYLNIKKITVVSKVAA